MAHYKVGDQNIELIVDEDLIAVRFKEPAKQSTRSAVSKKCGLGNFRDRKEIPREKFTILPVAQTAEPRNVRHQKAVKSLDQESEVARISDVYKVGNNRVIATDRILVGFKPGTKIFENILKKVNGTLIDSLGEDEYVVQLPEDADPLEVSSQLIKEKDVDYAEPDFVTIGKHVARRQVSPPAQPSPADPEEPKQYAPKITKAVEAWELQRGNPEIIIAVLDEGVDVNHEDLEASVRGTFDGVDNDTFQDPKPWDGHGTACAGLAAAVPNNNLGIRGIGGGCSIQAIRIAFSPNRGDDWKFSQHWVTRGIDWAWKNGASVLSNSWGGGLPSSAIFNAFERARTQGRDGKGCVIIAAAGNESGPVSSPANYPSVLAVSASNEFDEFKTETSSDGERWGSNFGPEVDLAAPGVHNFTTDIMGSGGYTDNNYFANFNGTSSATPIVAGAAALVLSANNDLNEREVRKILKDTADKVGSEPYIDGRNDQFGHGRLNVLAAVQKAKPQTPSADYLTVHKVIKNVPIKDMEKGRVSVSVGDTKISRDIKVHLDIKHTHVGDLSVNLVPPANSSESPVTLHNREGGGEHDLIKTYNVQNTPDLQRFVGKNLQGDWMLEVADKAEQDEGEIRSLSLELTY